MSHGFCSHSVSRGCNEDIMSALEVKMWLQALEGCLGNDVAWGYGRWKAYVRTGTYMCLNVLVT